MRADEMLALYAERHPDRVAFITADFDFGMRRARAVTVLSPNGRAYRHAVKWFTRSPMSDNEIARLLAFRCRRQLKKWLR